MWFVITLVFALLFFVFKALARHLYRLDSEDGQPWTYNVSVLLCWASLIGAAIAALATAASWAA